MQITLLKAKLHRVVVTDGDLNYEGSLGIDARFLEMLGLLPYEKILVGDITNGSRFETYIIPAPAGSGSIILNGAVAHLSQPGNLLVIMAFAHMTPEEAATWKPKVLAFEGRNQIKRTENI